MATKKILAALTTILIVESGGRPDATNTNGNGSVDYGMMQINSIHLPELARYGIGKADLYNGCKSVYMGAWILRQSIDKYGNTWAAIGSYNSPLSAHVMSRQGRYFSRGRHSRAMGQWMPEELPVNDKGPAVHLAPAGPWCTTCYVWLVLG